MLNKICCSHFIVLNVVFYVVLFKSEHLVLSVLLYLITLIIGKNTSIFIQWNIYVCRHVRGFFMHATCSLERSDLLFGKTCARLLQQHIFLTFNIFLTCTVWATCSIFWIPGLFIWLIVVVYYIPIIKRMYMYVFWLSTLKGLAQAKIIKKSVILFWLLNMTIWCKHVHRLELQKFFNFCAAHSPVRLDIKTKFPLSNYWQPCQ